MSSTSNPRRSSRLLSTARANPAFAQKVAQELPESARRLFVAQVSRPEPALPAAKRPGLAKCARSPYSESNGLAAQLALFALGGRRR